MERQWIGTLIAQGYIDTFRYLNPDAKSKYSWWDMKTFARERNVGWRIDYFFVSENLKESIKSSVIHENVPGSDHAPIELEIKL